MRNTPVPGASQEPRAESTKRKIPTPSDPRALTVADGHIHAGWVVPDGDVFHAFDYQGFYVGAFETMAAAANSLPYVDIVGAEA